MKRLLLILGVVILVLGGLMAPAFAQNEGEVTVTAELAHVSVTVSPSAISYGTVPIGATGIAPAEPVADPRIGVRNTGTCWVDFEIKGANTTNWTLDSSPGSDTYVHYFGWPPSTPTYNPLTTGYQDLCHHVSYSPDSGDSFKLMMDTPTSSTYFGTQETTVTILAVMVEKGISATMETDASTYSQGTPTATLTVTVLDDSDTPLTGLTSDQLRPMLRLVGEPSYPVTVTFAETNPGVSGIYQGSLDISGLAQGMYHVTVRVMDTLDRVTQGDADFEITAP